MRAHRWRWPRQATPIPVPRIGQDRINKQPKSWLDSTNLSRLVIRVTKRPHRRHSIDDDANKRGSNNEMEEFVCFLNTTERKVNKKKTMLKDSYGIDGDESFVGLLRISDTIVFFLPRSISVCSGLLPTGNSALERGRGDCNSLDQLDQHRRKTANMASVYPHCTARWERMREKVACVCVDVCCRQKRERKVFWFVGFTGWWEGCAVVSLIM